MAKLVTLVALALMAILLLESQTMVQAADGQFYNPASYGPGSLKSYQCGGQCQRRCSQTQYKKPCLFFCNKCCAACLCVPPGFYGNKQVCPCYNNWKTKRGGPKCP